MASTMASATGLLDGASPTCQSAWPRRRHGQPRPSTDLAHGLGHRGTTPSTRGAAPAAQDGWRYRPRTRTPTTLWPLAVLALLAASAVAPASAFCPQGCVCNTLRISCENAGLDVVPFQLNPEATTITLSRNNIITLEYTVNFYQQLQHLDVSQNRLQSLGSKNFDALERLTSLNVSSNEVGAFGKDAFKGLRSLRVLDLSNNLVEALDRHMFAEMHDLWELYLGRNRLSSVADGVFDALVNLRVLQLGDNQLLAVPSGAILRLTSLRALGLGANLIEDVAENAFANLRELGVLQLDNNVISSIDANALEGLGSLERLELADNNVTSVPTATLARLRRLSYLDLSGNMFASVGAAAFHSLAELRTLRLNRLVRLTRVDARAFADNKRLETVSLEGNVRLTSLPTRLFHGSPLLARVSVRGSALASLDAAHFPLDRLQTLDVADVPLTCNCSLLWLWLLCKEQRQHAIAINETAAAAAAAAAASAAAATPASSTLPPAPSPLPLGGLGGPEPSALSQLHPVILDMSRIRCAGPAALKGFALVDVPEAEVRCEATWMAVAMVTVVVLALFAATCTVLFFLSSGRWCSHEKDASDVSTDSFATQHSTLHKHGIGLNGLGGLGALPHVPAASPHPVMMMTPDMKVEPTYATIGLPGLPGNGLGRGGYDDYKKDSVNVTVNAYQRALNNWDSSFNGGNGAHHHTLTMGRHNHHDQVRHANGHGNSHGNGHGHGHKGGKASANGANGPPGPGNYGTYHNHYSMAIDMTKKPPHIVYV